MSRSNFLKILDNFSKLRVIFFSDFIVYYAHDNCHENVNYEIFGNINISQNSKKIMFDRKIDSFYCTKWKIYLWLKKIKDSDNEYQHDNNYRNATIGTNDIYRFVIWSKIFI
ncbi:hypothetical protein RF11_13576 [Thelohanellus kitauei]|uniref:Uncharacterized protein n=1 Tax=Thelohanellus kitauei TaxID=669202 RepID=A0A0C2NG81_THEKT|nr:hypothetical protein RF11_13576 [Thelohanellus kitauei]